VPDDADFAVPDHLGWHEQGAASSISASRWRAGGIVDGEGCERSRLRSALREMSPFAVNPILMPSQTSSSATSRRWTAPRSSRVAHHGVRLGEEIAGRRALALACPALRKAAAWR